MNMRRTRMPTVPNTIARVSEKAESRRQHEEERCVCVRGKGEDG